MTRTKRTEEQDVARILLQIDESTRVTRDDLNFIIEKRVKAGKTKTGEQKYEWHATCYFPSTHLLYQHMIQEAIRDPENKIENMHNLVVELEKKINELQNIIVTKHLRPLDK